MVYTTVSSSHMSFVYTKPNFAAVQRIRTERATQDRRLLEKLESVVQHYIDKDGSRNFLTQIEHKMGFYVKGEKYVNFDREIFKGWDSLIENAHRYPGKAHPATTLRMFLAFLRDEKYLLPQVKCEIWNNRANTVRFFWDDTEQAVEDARKAVEASETPHYEAHGYWWSKDDNPQTVEDARKAAEASENSEADTKETPHYYAHGYWWSKDDNPEDARKSAEARRLYGGEYYYSPTGQLVREG